MIKKLFKMFGSVTYISLPRHKVSGAIKGFAFVEFSTQQEAETAVEYFQWKKEWSMKRTRKRRDSGSAQSSLGRERERRRKRRRKRGRTRRRKFYKSLPHQQSVLIRNQRR